MMKGTVDIDILVTFGNGDRPLSSNGDQMPLTNQGSL